MLPSRQYRTAGAGLYNQNQLIANVNARLNAGFSLFGFYVLNHAMSNTDGIVTFPANPYNFQGEYGPPRQMCVTGSPWAVPSISSGTCASARS